MKKTPESEKVALSRKEALVRSQCPDTPGWRGNTVKLKCPCQKSKESSCLLGSPITRVKYKKERKLVLFYVYQRHKEI